MVHCCSKSSFLSQFVSVLPWLRSYTVIFMGDFNINLEADSPEKRELLDIIGYFSLAMIPTASKHHQPHSKASTLDLILSSIPDNLRSTTQFGHPGISHHDFVGASFEISHLRQPMTFTQGSFRNIDQSAAVYLPWDSIGSLLDANVTNLTRSWLLLSSDLPLCGLIIFVSLVL
jgi:hypothetical protein